MTFSELLITTPLQTSLKSVFLLAHGAGAPMDSDWMNQLTQLLTKEGITTVRFEFPYMAQRRQTGIKRPPNQTSVLLDCWRETASLLKSRFPLEKMFIGGKSMGGRMASLVADELHINGLICFGLPFHPPEKRSSPTDYFHCKKFLVRLLLFKENEILWGVRKKFFPTGYQKNIQVSFLESGDHSFKPLKKSGYTLEGHLFTAAKQAAGFIRSKS